MPPLASQTEALLKTTDRLQERTERLFDSTERLRTRAISLQSSTARLRAKTARLAELAPDKKSTDCVETPATSGNDLAHEEADTHDG